MTATGQQTWSDLLRHDVIPVLSAYLLLMGILLSYRRYRRSPKSPDRTPVEIRGWPPTWKGLIRFLYTMALGGYAVFIAVIVVYYFALGGQDVRFIRDALTGGVWLGFGIAVPALLLVAWIQERWTGRPGRKRTRGAAGA